MCLDVKTDRGKKLFENWLADEAICVNSGAIAAAKGMNSNSMFGL